ncbi:MAG: hypothetical protein GY842_27915, partial [bacterium]|nr:hypothetical protein [bacterium]
LVQVIFAFQSFASAAPSDLPATPLEIPAQVAKTDLTIYLHERAEGLSGALEYSTDLFDPATIARMAEDLGRLLEVIAANPAQRLPELFGAAEIEPLRATPARAKADEFADEITHILDRSNLTRNQLLVWLGQKLQPDVPLYNMSSVFSITGELDPGHFQRAFQALVSSSDGLRTVIREVDGIPQQRVNADPGY